MEPPEKPPKIDTSANAQPADGSPLPDTHTAAAVHTVLKKPPEALAEENKTRLREYGAPPLPTEEPPAFKPAELSEMPKTYDLITDSVDEIALNPLDKPKFVKAPNGTIAYGTDEGIGYKDVNEDAIVVNTGKGNGFAVIDGIGGGGHGDKAAQILAEEFQKGLNEGASFEDIQKSAHDRMRMKYMRGSGACYVGFKIDDKKLNVAQAGDVKLMVIDSNGAIKFETTDEGYGHVVFNAVSGSKQGNTTMNTVDLAVGDRIVVASDGLFDNLSPQEVSELIRGKTIQEAILLLNMNAKEKMQNHEDYKERGIEAKPDNISILIYDIESLE